MTGSDDVRWLDDDQQRSWRGLLIGMTLLLDQLDADLSRDFDISFTEYEILVRLSEHDDRMRMAQLANAMAHSRSRVTHTINRLEGAGLVSREMATSDGRGVYATLTRKGRLLLETAAPVHVAGVRQYLVDLADADDFAALGRVMNAVADTLIAGHEDRDIR